MQKDETADKQTFLREQIVEQGYEAEDFLEYLVAQKPEGDNINNWTLAELKNIVREYQKKHKHVESPVKVNEPQKKFSANYDIVTQKVMVDIFEEKEKRVQYEKFNLWDIAIKRQVQTVPFKPYLQGLHPVPEVTVEKPEVKVSGGFFFGIGKTTELWYTIRNNIISDSNVKRSDNDLSWLHQTLIKLYPGTVIPPFRVYSGDLQKEDTRSLQRRARLSGYYLTSIAQNELLFNTKLFIAFLTWTDYNRFTDLKKQADKIQPKKALETVPSLTGKIDLQLSTKNKSILRAANTFTNSIDSTLQKLHSEIHNLGRDSDKLADSILKTGNHFADLQEQYSNMINYAPEAKFDALSDVFITVNNILYSWGKLLQQNKKIFLENLGLFFRYQREENKTLAEFMAQRVEYEDDYLKFKGNLQNRKAKIAQDPSQWEVPKDVMGRISNVLDLSKQQVIALILPKQTKTENNMRQWLSFLNKSCEKQFKRACHLTSQRYRSIFKKIGQHLCQNTQLQLQQFKKFEKLYG